MFGKFSKQITKSAPPVANIMEVNARMLELMSKQQTLLFTGLISDSVKLVENLSDQTELKDMLAVQSVFAESVRERITDASKTTYTELTGLSAELMQGGLADVDKPQAPKESATETKTVKKAVVKKAPAKKTAATAKSKAATVTNKEVNKQVTTKAPKAVAKKSKVANKPAAKPVTNVTPADVKARVEK